MKPTMLLFLLVATSVVAGAQTRRDIFKPGTPVTWLGLDFSETRFIGDRERLGSQSDVLHLMDALNQLILNEPSKYDIAKAVGRTRVEKDASVTTDHNVNLEVNEMFSDQTRDHQRLRAPDIEQIIAAYDFKDLNGIGLMFNIESLSKLDEAASIWITFVNMDTKEVLFTERLVGKPKGFGLRNFWGGAIYNVLENMRKKEFEMWRRKNS